MSSKDVYKRQVPSLSEAEAWMVMLAGAVKIVPDTGLVMETVGGRLATATITAPVMPMVTCFVHSYKKVPAELNVLVKENGAV